MLEFEKKNQKFKMWLIQRLIYISFETYTKRMYLIVIQKFRDLQDIVIWLFFFFWKR